MGYEQLQSEQTPRFVFFGRKALLTGRLPFCNTGKVKRPCRLSLKGRLTQSHVKLRHWRGFKFLAIYDKVWLFCLIPCTEQRARLLTRE